MHPRDFICPCCAYRAVHYDRSNICAVCGWEWDRTQSLRPYSEVGPNHDTTLVCARRTFLRTGASTRHDLDWVRPPQTDEIPAREQRSVWMSRDLAEDWAAYRRPFQDDAGLRSPEVGPEFDLVRAALCFHDPMDMLETFRPGQFSPLSTYDDGLRGLMESLRRADSAVDVRGALFDMFLSMFRAEVVGPEERFDTLARNLYELTQGTDIVGTVGSDKLSH